jgi:hypothetical protein
MSEWWEQLRNVLRKWKVVIDVFFTAILVLFTGLLYCANRDYARTARLAQKPSLGVDFLTDDAGNRLNFGRYTIEADKLIDLAVEYENFGQFPTPSHQADFRVMLGGRPPDDDASWRLPETIPYFDCVTATKTKYNGPLFPGDMHSHIVHQEPKDMLSLSAQNFKDVTDGKKGIYLTGCIAFEDSANITYRTDFCLYFAHKDGEAAGYFAYCPAGNDTQ